jgi:hypothetical protein
MRFLVFFAALFLSYPAAAESLSGQVHDRSGKPVPSVRVSIYCPSFQGEKSKFTDSNGYFDFFDLKRGDRCRLEVRWGADLVFRQYYTISATPRIQINL